MTKFNQLTARKVETVKAPGMYADGGGLYLQVTKGGKSWIYRYRVDQRRVREMGLGPAHTITLAEAREKARQQRHLRIDGIDPIEAKHAAKAQAKLDAAKAMTFRDCAAAYLAAHRAGWRNAKHAAQWETTLREYADPVIGALPVQSIDTALVLKVLEPIWTTKPETASRLRGRIEAVLDWAKARGYRNGAENPARWKGHLDHLLPALAKVRRVEHHAALPYAELPSFLSTLRERQDVAARALEFTILTAARVGEALGARWSEVNLLDKTWTVPAAHMKAGKDHRVPLSDRALAILEEMQAHRTGDDGYVFPSSRAGVSVSDWTVRELVEDLGVTVHGFRSSFRDWCAECTNFPSEVAEIALAHTVGSKVEAAYRRSDMFEKRRRLAEAWSAYCTTTPADRGEVVVLRA